MFQKETVDARPAVFRSPSPATKRESIDATFPPFTTIAEQSNWVRTGRYEEVEQLCAELPKRYPGKVKCEPFGTTPLGRKMLWNSVNDAISTPRRLMKLPAT